MYKPDFPTHNYIELQRSKIPFGDSRSTTYETTYGAAMRPLTGDIQSQKINTKLLQRTHWTPGNIPTTQESEYVAKYRDFKTKASRDPAYTRDEMMRTTFTLGNDKDPFAERTKMAEYHEGIPKRENYQKEFTATHFDLTSTSAPKWETTNRAEFRPLSAQPATPINHHLNRGFGAKSSFEQMGAFETKTSLYQDTYKNYGNVRPETASSTAVTVNGDSIVFAQGMTQKNQRTSVKLGGIQTDYSTTTQDGYVKTRDVVSVDPELARQRRAQFQRSCVGQGTSAIPMYKQSVMHESIVPHPECRPPPPAEKTAFVSHHEYRNWVGPMTTTSQDAFQPKKAEVRQPFNMGLQQSHMNIGYPGINENRSLYSDTFTKPPPTMDRVDANAMRAFHTAHHSKTDTNSAARTGTTTYNDTYRPQPDFRPPPICDALKGGHNIVPNEERFNVKESNMKESFKPPPKIDQATRTDNKLQKSHLQLKSNCPPWTTTQQDYFLFNTYNMDNYNRVMAEKQAHKKTIK